jgi:hypothetical protein
MVVISIVYTFTPLGSPVKSYIASAQEIAYEDCMTIKKNIGHKNEVDCIKINQAKK